LFYSIDSPFLFSPLAAAAATTTAAGNDCGRFLLLF